MNLTAKWSVEQLNDENFEDALQTAWKHARGDDAEKVRWRLIEYRTEQTELAGPSGRILVH